MKLINHIYKKDFKTEFSYFAIAIFTGSVFENIKEKGMAHLLEHILFKGNKFIKNSKILNNKFNKMGVNINAFTSYYYTVYHVNTLNKYANEVIRMLFQMVFSPLITKKSFETEKKIVVNELIERNSDQDSYTFINSCRTIFPEENPLHYPIGGEIDIINKIDRKDLINFHKRYYNIDNALFFSHSYLKKKEIDKFINNSKRYVTLSSNKTTKSIDLLKSMKNKLELINKDVKNITSFKKMFPSIPSRFILITYFMKQPLTIKEELSLEIFQNFLANNMSSLLFRRLREKEKLIYSVIADDSNYYSFYSFEIFFNVKNKSADVNKSIKIVNDYIKKYSNNSIPIEEFKKFKKNLEINMKRDYNDGGVILSDVLDNYFFKNVKNVKNLYNEKFKVIKTIKLNDITNVIKKYFKNQYIFIA